MKGDPLRVWLCNKLIRPIRLTDRRVEAAEHLRICPLPSHDRLQNISGEVCTVQLCKFFKPTIAESAAPGLDRFQLACIVQPSKKDLCAGRPVFIHHRGNGRFPEVGNAQHINSPCDLRKNAVAHCPRYLAEHNSVALACGVALYAVHDLKRYERAFAAPAPARKIVKAVLPCFYILVQREIARGYEVLHGGGGGHAIPALLLCHFKGCYALFQLVPCYHCRISSKAVKRSARSF